MVWRLTKSGNLRSAGKGGGLSARPTTYRRPPRASRYSTQSGCPMEAASCRESPLVVLVDGLDVQVPGVNQIGQDVPAAVARNVCRRVSRAGPAKPARPVAYSSSHPAPTSTPAADAEAQSGPPARVRRERPATLPRAHPAPSGPRLRDPPPAPPCLSGPFPRRPDLPPQPSGSGLTTRPTGRRELRRGDYRPHWFHFEEKD